MYKKIKKSVKKLIFKKKLDNVIDIFYPIEKYNILTPSTHKLPEYQKHFKNYDKKIKNIIQSIEKFSKKGIIIDIGANIGDTAAYIRSFTDAKIICIEGDDFYLNYLMKNAEMLSNVKIFPVFVQGRNTEVNYRSIKNNGTARLEKTTHGIQVLFLPLVSILKDSNMSFQEIELLKIDTDGFDFDILLANEKLFRTFQIPVYFEYDINFNENAIFDSIEVIKMLESLNYHFVVYDNFGNLLNIIENNCESEFLKLNHYLKSCKIYKGGIYYFDILAIKDKNIINYIWINDNL
jgi:FkbM family methyltransferase